MVRRRKERSNQERRRSARIMAMEAQKERERIEMIRKEEEEAAKEEEEAAKEEEEAAKEEEEAAKEEENEMKSDVGDNHLIYDSEGENSRAMKKGRKLEEDMTFSLPQPMQEEPYYGDGSSSITAGNATLEMDMRDTYMLPNDNSLFSSVLDANSNFQLQYNENAGGGYRESLLRFVKGLGPVAQRMAMQKLENMDYMQRRNDELTHHHEQHEPPTEEGDFKIKVEADADEDEDEVVPSPKGP